MSDEQKYNNIVAEYEEQRRQILQQTLKEIEDGNTALINYITVFDSYQSLQKKNEFETEINKYAQLIMISAQNNIEINKDTAFSYECLSTVYNYQNDKEKTLYCINKAIEIEPNNADYYYARASYLDKYGYKKLAEQDYKKIVELNPEMAEHINLIKRTDKLINEGNFILWFVYIVLFVFIAYGVYSIIEIFI